MLVLAIALIVLKVYLVQMAGPEPAGPIAQTPMTTEVVVDTVIPFTPEEINTPGPVQSAYMGGMQRVLDEELGTPGAVKVLGVHANPAPGPVMLIEDLRAQVGRRGKCTLVYWLSAEESSKQPLLPPTSAAKLEAAVREAAKRQTGPEVPKVLKEVASGSVQAAEKPTIAVTVSTSFRCEARHELNVDIRAAGRALARKHDKMITGELQQFAERIISGFSSVRLADRCNDPTQDETMQLCIAPESLWVDYVTVQAASGSKDSLQSIVCQAGCALGSALSAKTAELIATVNSHLSGFELDKEMVSEISCAPSLTEGEECERCS